MPKEKKTTKSVSKKVAKKKTRIVLLDSHAIIHRAYHALPDFASTKGEPTGALYGLSSMLLRIIGDFKPDHIIACFDLPEKTFRHEAYKEYKAGRRKADPALVAQLIRARDLFTAFGIPIYDKPGFEADDMLGTIVEQLKNDPEVEIVIASGDMDTLQLVDKKKVQVFTLKKGINDTILYDEAAVLARFGFLPKLLPDYKGLRGDPSDNIIGIAGIGEKTATTLITTFGTIENIYKKLKKDGEGYPSFREIGITPRIIELLKEGEEEALFSKTLAQIRRDAPIDFTIPPQEWRGVCKSETVEALFRELEFKSLLERFYKVFRLEQQGMEIKKEEQIEPLRLAKLQIGLWLLNSEKTNPSLQDILETLNVETVAAAEKETAARIKAENLTYVYEQIELPLIDIISNMSKRGILLDVKYLKKISEEYHTNLDLIQARIWKSAGKEFNINSPKQLSEILFDHLGLSVKGLKKSDGGQRSTKVTELEKLKGMHPIIDDIMAHREVQKLLSTYIDTLPLLIDTDGRLRTQFIQTGTTTGRFSSINPNLQNIPIKSELGKNIRRAFVADQGHTLLSFDYSQIELRIAALLSADPGLAEAFQSKKDIHASVAARVFGVPENEVTAEMRRRAKVINFGIIYGMGVSALKQNLGTDRAEAEKFYHDYFAAFPSVEMYLESVKAFARKNGYTETLFGRRRYFPAIKSSIPFMKAMAERMATNAPIQGTAADVIKLAMISVTEMLKEEKLSNKVHMLLQVHDELIFEVEESVVEKVTPLIQKAMENAISAQFLKGKPEIPLSVGTGTAKTWGELK